MKIVKTQYGELINVDNVHMFGIRENNVFATGILGLDDEVKIVMIAEYSKKEIAKSELERLFEFLLHSERNDFKFKRYE